MQKVNLCNIVSASWPLLIFLFLFQHSYAEVDFHNNIPPFPFYEDTFFDSMPDEMSFIDSTLENYLDDAAGIKKNINPVTILNILNSIGIMDLLEQPFFLQTRMLFQKNSLDDPLIDATTIIQGQKTSLYMPSLFFEFLTTNDDFFEKYFALTAPGFLEAIKRSIQNINSELLNQFNVDNIFDIISRIKIHQRHLGASCLASHASETYCFRALFLLHYIERNFFLTNADTDALLFELGLPPSDDSTFTNNHLVSDQIGVGDVRLEVEVQAKKSLTNSINVGCFADIPTAFAFKKGLLGRNFPDVSTLPSFDFELLSSAAFGESSEKISQFLTNFFLDALDRISADLLHTDLGIYPHIGIGFFLRTKSRLSHFLEGPWTHRIVFKNNISIEYLTPGNQKIFYTTKIDQAEFDAFSLEAIINSDNEDLQIAALNFIERKIVEKFFLRAFSSLVQPGFVFRWGSVLKFLITERSKISIGSEFFYKGKDHIINIHAPHDVKKTLNKSIANENQARETSLFATYGYSWERRDYSADFFVSLKATTSMDKNTLTGYECVAGWKVEF